VFSLYIFDTAQLQGVNLHSFTWPWLPSLENSSRTPKSTHIKEYGISHFHRLGRSKEKTKMSALRTAVLLQQSLLSLDSVRLGRIVRDAREPHQDFLDPFQSDNPDAIVKRHQNFDEILKSSKSVSLRTRLTKLVSTTCEYQDANIVTMTADEANTYQLTNSGSWFNKACKLNDTRSWIIESIEHGYDLYLIVGYFTVKNARIREEIITRRQTGGEFEIPATILTTTPVSLTPALGAGAGTRQRHVRTFDVHGEQVYAVQYRKVVFKWYSSRSLDSASLEKSNRWKIQWGVRGQEDDGEDDVLEANLTDELELDFEEQYVSEDGTEEFLF